MFYQDDTRIYAKKPVIIYVDPSAKECYLENKEEYFTKDIVPLLDKLVGVPKEVVYYIVFPWRCEGAKFLDVWYFWAIENECGPLANVVVLDEEGNQVNELGSSCGNTRIAIGLEAQLFKNLSQKFSGNELLVEYCFGLRPELPVSKK